MIEIERLQHTLHARTRGFQRKVERSHRIIEEAMDTMQTPYVAYSSGVDSLCVLDMLYSTGHRLPVLWGDDGADFPESLDFLQSTEARYGFRLIRIRSMNPWKTWCQEMGRPELADDPAAHESWMNPCTWDNAWHTLTRDANRHGYTGVFMGMLASESRDRRLVLHSGTRPLYQVKSENNIWHCSPLALWNKADVWAYIISRELPYNPVYDKLADLGIPLEHRRVAALTCFRIMHMGSVVALRSGWPSLYNQLAATFPRVREFS